MLTAANQTPLDVCRDLGEYLAFAYCQLSKFVEYQGVAHLQAAERVLTELLIVALAMTPRTRQSTSFHRRDGHVKLVKCAGTHNVSDALITSLGRSRQTHGTTRGTRALFGLL
jgi:hypothetical protein